MKRCTSCKIEKKESDFNFKSKSLGKLNSHCKDCSRAYIKNHYIQNRDYYLIKARKRNLLVRKVIKEYILNYLLSHPCVDCGETNPVVLEFDHISNKLKDVTRLARDNVINKVKEEIEKCEVRCANCHRRKTAKTYGSIK